MTYSGASCRSDREPRRVRKVRLQMPGDRLDEKAMLRDRKDVLAFGLAVPARDAGKAVGDVVELDVERGGVEEVEAAAREHPLPGARRRHHRRSARAAHSAWR